MTRAGFIRAIQAAGFTVHDQEYQLILHYRGHFICTIHEADSPEWEVLAEHLWRIRSLYG